MAELLKGAPVARVLTEELAARCVALRERGVVPTLAIVRVGEREDDLRARCAQALRKGWH